MPAKRNSINNQNREIEIFDDFIILLTLNIKKELGFCFVGDEYSKEGQFADYLNMEIQQGTTKSSSCSDAKKNTYYNSLQTNLQKQINNSPYAGVID